MKILWLNWKDRKHPQAGGAELVNEELAKRLAKDGHEVLFITAGFPGSQKEEERDGFKIVRLGGYFSVYWQAYRYYKKHLQGWPDLVIDEINTIPFFVKFYAKQRNIIFIHQLCRKVWFYEMPFPINIFGYIAEPIYMRLLKDRKVITVSESTKKDLIGVGFKAENIGIISEGIEIEPVPNLNKIVKYNKPTMLSLGAIRPMKRTDHIIKAFEMAKRNISSLQLIVAGGGEGKYGKKVLDTIKSSPFTDSIQYMGKVGKEKKVELLQKSHLICVTSVKEGWGLIVTEANSQGTPAVVYNVDGLRDAVKNHETGLVCHRNTPEKLAENMNRLINDSNLYGSLRMNAWSWSKQINFDISYKQFVDSLKKDE